MGEICMGIYTLMRQTTQGDLHIHCSQSLNPLHHNGSLLEFASLALFTKDEASLGAIITEVMKFLVEKYAPDGQVNWLRGWAYWYVGLDST